MLSASLTFAVNLDYGPDYGRLDILDAKWVIICRLELVVRLFPGLRSYECNWFKDNEKYFFLFSKNIAIFIGDK